MTIGDFNQKNREEAEKELYQCCGSSKWVEKLLLDFPFSSEEDMVNKATEIWYKSCTEADWLEAFSQHPKIGDLESLEKKYAATQHLAGKEQAQVSLATSDTLNALKEANETYELKNGFIYIICATGKSANEMLRLLSDRVENSRTEELHIAMGEQHKITLIRLQKLLSHSDWSFLKVSQLTTHVLDTSMGKPGAGMTIKLQELKESKWQVKAQGVTNLDGRIPDLLPPNKNLDPGNYRMKFETGAYFKSLEIVGFYPQVEIQFTVFDDQHYHVPLLINPFGYSTYRGS